MIIICFMVGVPPRVEREVDGVAQNRVEFGLEYELFLHLRLELGPEVFLQVHLVLYDVVVGVLGAYELREVVVVFRGAPRQPFFGEGSLVEVEERSRRGLASSLSIAVVVTRTADATSRLPRGGVVEEVMVVEVVVVVVVGEELLLVVGESVSVEAEILYVVAEELVLGALVMQAVLLEVALDVLGGQAVGLRREHEAF